MAGGEMTLAALEDLVRNLCFEESQDTGLFTSARLDVFINQAHRELWALVANIQSSYLSKTSVDKSIGKTGLDLSDDGLDDEGVHVIVRVEWRDGNGNYIPIEPGHVNEIASTSGSNSISDMVTFTWHMVGETMFLNPLPQQAQTVRVTYVPNTADLSDTEESAVAPFAGALKSFHHIVGWRAAELALTKDEKSHLGPRFNEMRDEFKNYIRRRHIQTSRRIRQSISSED